MTHEVVPASRTEEGTLKAALAVLVAILLVTGCAALFNSQSKGVIFTSDPTGAEVFINGRSYGRTPLALNMRQKGNYTYVVTFRAQDFEDRSYSLDTAVGAGWIILDVLGGLIPIVIDAASGSWYSLQNKAIHGVLLQTRIPVATDSVSVTPAPPRPNQTLVEPTRPVAITGPRELRRVPGTPVTVELEDGSLLPAYSIEPWGEGTYRVMMTNGEREYVGGNKIRAVVDSTGNDWTDRVLEKRARVPPR